MKRIYLALLLLTIGLSAGAQKQVNIYAATDKIALEIPAAKTKNTTDIAAYINDHFSTETDKVRAIFIWVASNIAYDVENMYAININETREDKIAKALNTRKGICENYAAVFNDICRKCALESEIVVGYTQQPGLHTMMRHGWCAVKVDGEWKLFDPTWGAGVIDDDQFRPHINNEYFMAAPAALIKTHMPFDPIWQLSHYPVSNKEFTDKNTALSKGAYFAYDDTIAFFRKLAELEQMEAELRRLERMGVSNIVVHDRVADLRNNIDVNRQNDKVREQGKIVDIYNDALKDLNNAVNEVNDFINYRNKQFTPARPDAQIKAMLDSAETLINRADVKMRAIRGKFDKVDELMGPVTKTIDDVAAAVQEHKTWLGTYMSKSKLGRKSMFYTRLQSGKR